MVIASRRLQTSKIVIIVVPRAMISMIMTIRLTDDGTSNDDDDHSEGIGISLIIVVITDIIDLRY